MIIKSVNINSFGGIKNKKINLYKLFKYSTLFIVKIIIILLNYGNNIFLIKDL